MAYSDWKRNHPWIVWGSIGANQYHSPASAFYLRVFVSIHTRTVICRAWYSNTYIHGWNISSE